jgi:hypothetical protein
MSKGRVGEDRGSKDMGHQDVLLSFLTSLGQLGDLKIASCLDIPINNSQPM